MLDGASRLRLQGSRRSSGGKIPASGSTAYTVIGLVFALLIGGYFVYRISGVVLAFLLTILLSIILAAPVNYLARGG